MGIEPEANYIDLSVWQVSLAALLILVNGAISAVLRLRLAPMLLLASTRTICQLLLVGAILQWVFANASGPLVVGLMIVMTLIAGFTAATRSDKRIAGLWLNTLISMWASSWLITAFALFVVLRPITPWYNPQYAIPLLGMILGNTLNGVSLGQQTLLDLLANQRGRVEMLLSLGATRWEAALEPMQQAVRTGMTPIINSMMIVGLVSLPGMMTGQILSGASPASAVKYQIVIMFLIAAGTALGTVLSVLAGYWRLFNAQHQFLHERIETKSRGAGRFQRQ